MYKVSNSLTSTYGNDMAADFKTKQGPEMPAVTVSNRRMTNIPVGDGNYIQGIRKNQDLQGNFEGNAGADFEVPRFKPLRYTPGLKCDAHLESLRPAREAKHPAIQGGDQWKKKLIQQPQTFDGSFVNADMQQFRPVPAENPGEDPWYASRLPDPSMQAVDRLAMPYNYGGPVMSPYSQMYPQDELSQIKMRNRRYQNAVTQEMMSLNPMGGCGMGMGMGMGMPQHQHPMIMPTVPAPPPPQGFEYEMAMDELALLDQDLNMTRRTTRPFVPTNNPGYWGLQRQAQMMEQEPLTHKAPNLAPPTSVDQLPPPKPVVRAPLTEAAMPKSNRPEVRIADQIAIRSFVLADKVPRIGGSKPAEPKEPVKSAESPV